MVTDQVTLTVKKKLKTLEQQWHTFTHGAHFRNVVNQTESYLKNYHLNYLLADTTQAKPLTDADRDYYIASLKKMQRCGLKQFFAVKPDYPFTHYTLVCIQRQLKNTLPVRVFETRQDAIITLQNLNLLDNQLSLFEN